MLTGIEFVKDRRNYGNQKILVLCTGNSCRSQMAEGFLKKYKPEWQVESAGISPTRVNPAAIEVMAEQGIDISGYRSKGVEEFLGQTFDYIITVCDHAKEACPTFPGKGKYIHWSIKDPDRGYGSKEKKLIEFRKTRDEIENRIKTFVGEENS
ncbi:MAG: arsenate reductase ArsC [Actinomycetota bacterium]|nr:arsenate reductase ArsC [Actinomycetota bacterium]